MLNRLQDVFMSFQQHDVSCVDLGGIASILHGVPRATVDLDMLSGGNARRLLDAGLGTASLDSPEGVSANEMTISCDLKACDPRGGPGQG